MRKYLRLVNFYFSQPQHIEIPPLDSTFEYDPVFATYKMTSILSSIVGIIISLLIINGIQFLLWLSQKSKQNQQKPGNRISETVNHNQRSTVRYSRPRHEAAENFCTADQSNSQNETFADFRARLLSARDVTGPQSEVSVGSFTQKKDGKQLRMKFREVKERAKNRIQTVTDKYSTKVRKAGRRSLSVSTNSTVEDDSSKTPHYDDDDPPPPYSLHWFELSFGYPWS